VLKLSSDVSDVFTKVIKLSFEVSECEPLPTGSKRLTHEHKDINAFFERFKPSVQDPAAGNAAADTGGDSNSGGVGPGRYSPPHHRHTLITLDY
jgi:hypothetical protein